MLEWGLYKGLITPDEQFASAKDGEGDENVLNDAQIKVIIFDTICLYHHI